MRHIFFPHWIAFRPELVYDRRHIHRVPDDHGIREQIQTAGLIGLVLLLFAPNRALVGKEQKLPQRVAECPQHTQLVIMTVPVSVLMHHIGQPFAFDKVYRSILGNRAAMGCIKVAQDRHSFQ